MYLAASILILGGLIATTVAQCPSPYVQLNPNHTMCRTDKGTAIPLTTSDKAVVLDRHNAWRRNVTVIAADMQKMVWDDNLATVAAKWARQCVVGHDAYAQRAEPALPGVTIGQNAAGGYPDVLSAVNAWASEISDFTYGVKPTKVTGHYTQIVFANTARVGCSQADCSGVAGSYPKVQICNYALGQNGANVDTKPYKQSTTGSSCSDCSGKCDSSGKLCDCGGKVCMNGATLNLTACTCTCARGYTGELCQSKNCPGQDTTQCTMYMDYFAKQGINGCIYGNVKKETCPYRCGFCP